MKNIWFAMVMICSCAQAQNLIPSSQIGDTTLTLKGYSQSIYRRDARDNFSTRLTVVQSTLEAKTWKWYSELNLAHADDTDVEVLRRCYLELKVSDAWQVRLGRVFLSSYSTPAAFDLETILYPRSDQFYVRAWGVQVIGNPGNGWSLSADITGDPRAQYDDFNSFSAPALSGRLQKEWGSISAGVNAEIAEEYRIGSIDATWKPCTTMTLRGALYAAKYDDQILGGYRGGYFFAGYQPVPWFEVHSMFDSSRFETADGRDTSWTNGIRLMTLERNLSFTLDYESTIEGLRGDQVLARIQFRF